MHTTPGPVGDPIGFQDPRADSCKMSSFEDLVFLQMRALKEYLVIRLLPAIARPCQIMSAPVWALLLCTATAGAAEKPALVIRGGSVFDPVSGTMNRDWTIVIEGERIKAVGTPER